LFTVAAEDFEHIGWRGRMRVIMGLAYCIQHMHELNPPVAHPDLQSSSILLSEDGAAKVHTSIYAFSIANCCACSLSETVFAADGFEYSYRNTG